MQMPMPDDWDGASFCRWAICWPDSNQWRAILHGLVETPTRGRFWDFDTGNFESLRDSFLPAYEYNYQLQEVVMACGDTAISDALNNIAVALGRLSAGGGGGNCASYCYSEATSSPLFYVTIDDVSYPIYGSTPIAVLPESGFPVGYESEAVYLADKCAKANKMADDLIGSLDQLGSVIWYQSVLGVAFLGACLVGLITVPPVAIPILLFLLVGTEALDTALIQAANYLDTHREELVCALYEGESVEAVLGAVGALLVTMVGYLAFSSPVAAAVKTVILYLLTGDTLNVLFTASALGAYPEADCSGCGEEEFPVIQVRDVNGAWVDSDLVWNEPVTFTPIQEGNGFYYAMLRLKPPGGQQTGVYKFVVTNSSYANGGSCVSNFGGNGEYQNVAIGEDSNTGWQFGCNNGSTFFTGTFTLV